MQPSDLGQQAMAYFRCCPLYAKSLGADSFFGWRLLSIFLLVPCCWSYGFKLCYQALSSQQASNHSHWHDMPTANLDDGVGRSSRAIGRPHLAIMVSGRNSFFRFDRARF